MLFCCQVRDPISVKININHKLARYFLLLFYKGNTDTTGSFWYISAYFFKELFIGRKLYFSMRGRGVICHRIGASFLGQCGGAPPCGGICFNKWSGMGGSYAVVVSGPQLQETLFSGIISYFCILFYRTYQIYSIYQILIPLEYPSLLTKDFYKAHNVSLVRLSYYTKT